MTFFSGMKKTLLTICIGVLLSFQSHNATALELYAILHDNCTPGIGLIIGVDHQSIFLLNTNGELVELEKKGIEHILVYNTLDNPFSKIDLSASLVDLARSVRVQGEEDSHFIGWPIRFLDQLIVFFDVEGKTHLVDIETIQGFNIVEEFSNSSKTIEQYKTYQFGLGSNIPECRELNDPANDRIQPTRMVSDPIKISKFLQVYQKGFTKLDRLQKRTTFYARPYLYEKKTKVGLVVGRDDFQEELPGLMPLNFQWPTGSNYGPQGILNLGLYTNKMLPNVEPVFGVRFEGKYHFLSVFFAGNPWAFSYGTDFIIRQRLFFEKFFSRMDAEGPAVFPQYNQIALTGVEWGPYSIMGGYYYPVIAIQGNNIFREVLAEHSLPVAALKYTTQGTTYQLVLSDIKLSSNEPSANHINLIYAAEMSQATALTTASSQLINEMDNFSLKSQFIRFNFTMDLADQVQIGLSEVLFSGTYQETLKNRDYHLSFNQYITSALMQQEFGDYVSLKFYLNYFIRHYHSQSESHDTESSQNKFSLAVVVEFIL